MKNDHWHSVIKHFLRSTLTWGVFFLGVLMLQGSVYADNIDFGAGSDFELGAGARALGMGRAFTAVADDATAGFWNPAGLSQMELYDYEAGLEYLFLPNGVNASYLAYAFQVPQTGSFEISWMNISTRGIEALDEHEQPAGSFNSSENLIIMSFGRKAYGLLKGLSLGGNLKLLQTKLQNVTAVGFGADLGALWNPVLYWDHTLGLVVQNLGQSLYWNTTNQTIESSALVAKLGLALRFFRSEDEMYFTHLNTSLELEYAPNRSLGFCLGGEYWLVQNVGIRAGYTGQEITVGASYRPDYYEVCYAYLYDLSVNAFHQHRFSLNLRFK